MAEGRKEPQAATAAELLSRFFDGIESIGKSQDSGAICPGQDGEACSIAPDETIQQGYAKESAAARPSDERGAGPAEKVRGPQIAQGATAAAGGPTSASPVAAGGTELFGSSGRPMDSFQSQVMQDMAMREERRKEYQLREEKEDAERRQGGAPGGGGPGGAAGDGSSGVMKRTGRSTKLAFGHDLPDCEYAFEMEMEQKAKLSILHGLRWQTAHSWQSVYGLRGAMAEEGEDPRIRVLIGGEGTAAPVALFELNATATFNMMDPILAYNGDWAIDCLLMHQQRKSARRPLGFVLQGSGPHFCPGGNHHPVSPHESTPLTMGVGEGGLVWMRLREFMIPGITVFTGSSIGGGVAISLQQQDRVAAQSASMSFGNLSRGACPIMILSKNLPETVGMAAAVYIYLGDATVSAFGALQAGMVHSVSSAFALAKNLGFRLTKQIASHPVTSQVVRTRTPYSMERYLGEAMGFTFCAKGGAMFANVKSARAQKAFAEPPVGEKSKDDSALTNGRYQQAQEYHGSARPAHAAQIATSPRFLRTMHGGPACGQCGDQNADGFVYGESFFCASCLTLLGLQRDGQEESLRINVPKSEREAARAMMCAECESTSAKGQWGMDDVHSGFWYCNQCWHKWYPAWSAAEWGDDVPTDIGSGYSDSGTEGTVIDSDCVTCSAADGGAEL